MTKKYFSISEICRLCQLPLHKLRYIEKTDKNFTVTKIRNRRYYTQQNIQYLLSHYTQLNLSTDLSKIDTASITKESTYHLNNTQLLKQIDQLLNKFSNLL